MTLPIFRLIFVLSSLIVITACDKQDRSDQASSNLVQLSSVATSTDTDTAQSRTVNLIQPHSKKWWHDAVIYQVWPRSFHDFDGDGNGDFKGLTSKLQYLKMLGIDAVWLTPFFESPSYHGYDTTNFYAIDSDYGKMEDFDAFIQESKVLGIKVIIDLVVNHVSDQHPWFYKSLAKDPGFEDYFKWSKSLPENYGLAWSATPDPTKVWHYKEAQKVWYYGTFGYQQPDLNLENPKVVNEIESIAAFWLKKGVDGFRLDAVRHLIEEGGIPNQADTQSTKKFLEKFNKYVKSINPDAYVIGEAFADTATVASYFDNGAGLDAAFDFDFAMNVRTSTELKNKVREKNEQEEKDYFEQIKESYWANYSQHADLNVPQYFFASFISNHDLDRSTWATGNDPIQIQIAASLLLTSPNTTFIYYGEEIGMSQASIGDDVYRRAPMQWDRSENAGFNSTGKRWVDNGNWFPWNANFIEWWNTYWTENRSTGSANNVESQIVNSKSLINFYKNIIAVRKQEIALRNPTQLRFYENTDSVFAIKYSRDQESLWVILNLNPNKNVVFRRPAVMHGQLKNLLDNSEIPPSSELLLKPGQLLILKIAANS